VDRTARLWDMTADDPAAEPVLLKGHSDLINVLTFSPDGTHLITAGDTFLDNTARSWDLDVLNRRARAEDGDIASILLRGQESEAKAIAISADSRWLVLGGEDGRLTFWRLKIDDLVESACQVAGRNLTVAEWEQFFPGDAYRQTCPEWPAAEGMATQETRVASDG
jgi:WD40 repeat protein